MVVVFPTPQSFWFGRAQDEPARNLPSGVVNRQLAEATWPSRPGRGEDRNRAIVQAPGGFSAVSAVAGMNQQVLMETESLCLHGGTGCPAALQVKAQTPTPYLPSDGMNAQLTKLSFEGPPDFVEIDSTQQSWEPPPMWLAPPRPGRLSATQ